MAALVRWGGGQWQWPLSGCRGHKDEEDEERGQPPQQGVRRPPSSKTSTIILNCFILFYQSTCSASSSCLIVVANVIRFLATSSSSTHQWDALNAAGNDSRHWRCPSCCVIVAIVVASLPLAPIHAGHCLSISYLSVPVAGWLLLARQLCLLLVSIKAVAHHPKFSLAWNCINYWLDTDRGERESGDWQTNNFKLG